MTLRLFLLYNWQRQLSILIREGGSLYAEDSLGFVRDHDHCGRGDVPGLTFFTLGYMIGVGMLLDGISLFLMIGKELFRKWMRKSCQNKHLDGTVSQKM